MLLITNSSSAMYDWRQSVHARRFATIVILQQLLTSIIIVLQASTLAQLPQNKTILFSNSTTITTTTMRQAKAINLDSHQRLRQNLKGSLQLTTTSTSERRSDPGIVSTTASGQNQQSQVSTDKRAFVVEFLRLLHEQYGSPENIAADKKKTAEKQTQNIEDRLSSTSVPMMMTQLLEAIGADGDMKRLTDWVRSSFTLASLGEVTTQFVVGKLGSVNCPAILRPDKEEALVPRFLLFNEHFVDVPFELSINPNANECSTNAKFDPARRTLVLVHGYLTGYTIVDGVTNIKNRLLDLNKLANERAMETFVKASHLADDHAFYNASNSPPGQPNYVFTEDLDMKIRSQLYNVVIIDWFNGANPSPRSNYIRAAVNAQVVGKLIARFLSALVVQCKTPSTNIHILAHSLGCHVSGFTGKAMNAAGHRLGRITHLDPVGLCFGRLFSRPQYRLSPDDALDTQAVHVSMNIFDNPLDGAHSNFLVNGGRDQLGCGGRSEVKNATTSSISLLFDPAARFNPCSHLRALDLFEDDHSSRPGQCQFVGYRCANYDRFLAGKCGHCDSINSQCRLMSLPPIRMDFRKTSPANAPVPSSLLNHPISLNLSPQAPNFNQHLANLPQGSLDLYSSDHLFMGQSLETLSSNSNNNYTNDFPGSAIQGVAGNVSQTSEQTWQASGAKRSVVAGPQSMLKTQTVMNPVAPAETMFGAPAYIVGEKNGVSRVRRSSIERRFSSSIDEQRDRLAQALGKLRADTRSVLAESLTNLREHIVSGIRDNNLEVSLADDEAAHNGSSGIDDNNNDDEPTMTTIAYSTALHQDRFHYNSLSQSNATNPTMISGTAQGERTNFSTMTTPPVMLMTTVKQPMPTPMPTVGGGADSEPSHRVHSDAFDQVPIGSQKIPTGSLNMPLFYLGTGAVSPFCVNYYQLRILIAESRLLRVLHSQGLASNRLAPQLSQQSGGIISAAATMQQRAQSAFGRDMLHMTVKLSDTGGHFFKGFSLLEHARWLPRVANDLAPPRQPSAFVAPMANEPLIEITMLLNTTSPEPVKVGESILSYYFHPIVMADRIEVNYMSNISPDIRATYSSSLCPVAINDKFQLIRYIECHRISDNIRE